MLHDTVSKLNASRTAHFIYLLADWQLCWKACSCWLLTPLRSISLRIVTLKGWTAPWGRGGGWNILLVRSKTCKKSQRVQHSKCNCQGSQPSVGQEKRIEVKTEAFAPSQQNKKHWPWHSQVILAFPANHHLSSISGYSLTSTIYQMRTEKKYDMGML